MMIILSVLVLGGLALFFAVVISGAARRFAVDEDPLVARIEDLLPGTNCGACGLAGCHAAAEALAARKVECDVCLAGGQETADRLAALLGVEAAAANRRVAVIHCQGGRDRTETRFTYRGVSTCLSAHLTAGGPGRCFYGCLGYADCVRACPFHALAIGPAGLPVVDEALCVGCGKCVKACPRRIITLIPRQQRVYLGCVSRDRGRAVKDACSVGCIACGICVRVSAEGLIAMEDNLPRLHYDEGADFSPAAEKCPMKCFVSRS